MTSPSEEVLMKRTLGIEQARRPGVSDVSLKTVAGPCHRARGSACKM
jgi:hypothetical protein